MYKSFIYLTQSREYTYRPIVFLISFVIFFENRFNELLKLWCMKKATMYLFSLITWTRISSTWDVTFGSSFSSSFNVWSKNVYWKEKFGLSSFEILPLIALKFGWFLYFKISAFIGSKSFKLKPSVFSLGKCFDRYFNSIVKVIIETFQNFLLSVIELVLMLAK